MDPETGSNQEKDTDKFHKEENIEFSTHSAFNLGVIFSWLAAFCAIFLTVFFWWLNRDLETSLSVRQTEKNNIVTEITNPINIEVEKKAAGFKSSVLALKKAKAEKFNVTEFTKELNKKITNDVVLTSLSFGSDGALSLSGETTTYRSTADLMLALKSWNMLSEVDLKSVSIQEKDDGSKVVAFSITAKADKTQAAVPAATTSTTPTTTPTITPTTDTNNPFNTNSMSYQGGINEKN